MPTPRGEGAPRFDLALRHRLTPHGLEKLEHRLALVRDIESGLSIRDALLRSKLNVTERSAARLVGRFRREGVEALIDRRLLAQVPGRNPRMVRTPLVEALVRRADARETQSDPINATAIRRSIAPVLLAHAIPVPSVSTIRRILASRDSKEGQ